MVAGSLRGSPGAWGWAVSVRGAGKLALRQRPSESPRPVLSGGGLLPACHAAPHAPQARPVSPLAPWAPFPFGVRQQTDPEDSWPCLAHPLLLTSLLLACLPSWMAVEASVPGQTHSGQTLRPSTRASTVLGPTTGSC